MLKEGEVEGDRERNGEGDKEGDGEEDGDGEVDGEEDKADKEDPVDQSQNNTEGIFPLTPFNKVFMDVLFFLI